LPPDDRRDVGHVGKGLADRRVEVRVVVLLARRNEAHRLVDAGAQRTFGAARVRYEGGDVGFRAPRQTRQHLVRVGELRHCARAHERRGLDAAHAGGDHRVDDLRLDRRVDELRFGLEAVARAHFGHGDVRPFASRFGVVHDPSLGDMALVQRADLVGTVPQLAQEGVGVHPQVRRRPVDATGVVAELDREAQHIELAVHRMVDRDARPDFDLVALRHC
jgi:hypothetical protein